MSEGRKSCAPHAPSLQSRELHGRVAFEDGAHYSFLGIGSLRIWTLGWDAAAGPAGSKEEATAGTAPRRDWPMS